MRIVVRNLAILALLATTDLRRLATLGGPESLLGCGLGRRLPRWIDRMSTLWRLGCSQSELPANSW